MRKNYLEGEKSWKMIPMLIDNSSTGSDIFRLSNLSLLR